MKAMVNKEVLLKVACIDVGTNSIRLLLANYKEGQFEDARKKLMMTRLGKGVNETKMLDVERMKDSVDAIDRFKREAIAFGAEHIFIMATSAVRDSKNSDIFKQMIFNQTGLQLEVISGKKEAEIGFKGVLMGAQQTEENLLIIDIGGGSTELIVGNQQGIIFSHSLDIGAVRLTGAFITHDPATEDEKSTMEAYVREQLETIIYEISRYKISEAVGIGGTATTFATMVHQVSVYSRQTVHGLCVTKEQIRDYNQKLLHLSVEERKKIVGLEEKRADIIYAGGLILEQVLEQLAIENYYASDYDNLEGFIVDKLG